MLNKQLIIVFIILVNILASPSIFAAGGIEFSVIPDKEEFTKSDPISVKFKLKNNTDTPIYINKRFHLNPKDSPADQREVTLTVISPSGEELKHAKSYETGFPRTGYFIELKPGEDFVSDKSSYVKNLFGFDEAGDYKVTATYQNIYGREIGIDAITDKLESRTVIIKIVEKKKKEEKKGEEKE